MAITYATLSHTHTLYHLLFYSLELTNSLHFSWPKRANFLLHIWCTIGYFHENEIHSICALKCINSAIFFSEYYKIECCTGLISTFTQVIHLVVTYCFHRIEVLKRHWCEFLIHLYTPLGFSIVDCFIYAIRMYSEIMRDAKQNTWIVKHIAHKNVSVTHVNDINAHTHTHSFTHFLK